MARRILEANMRIPLFLIILLTGAPLGADFVVQTRFHDSAYYAYGVMNRAVEESGEYWFGSGVLAVSWPGIRFVLRSRENRLTIIKPDARVFCEVPLPFPGRALCSQKLLEYFAQDEAFGSAVWESECQTIGGHLCRRASIALTVADQGSVYEQRQETCWLTREVPFDLELYERFERAIREIYRHLTHWDGALVGQWNALEGFPWRRESTLYVKGGSRESHEEVVSLEERPPPVDCYAVPPGYRRLPELTEEFIVYDAFHGRYGIFK